MLVDRAGKIQLGARKICHPFSMYKVVGVGEGIACFMRTGTGGTAFFIDDAIVG